MAADFAAVVAEATAAAAAVELKAVESGHCPTAGEAVGSVAHRLAVAEIAVIDSGVEERERLASFRNTKRKSRRSIEVDKRATYQYLRLQILGRLELLSGWLKSGRLSLDMLLLVQ